MIKNLTPHELLIFGSPDWTDTPVRVSPSGEVARIHVTETLTGQQEGVPLFQSTHGEVEGLPPQEEGVLLVVSLVVRLTVADRTDVASPGRLLRNAGGQPMGCYGLVLN